MSANEAVSIRMIPMSDGTVHAYAPCDAGRRTHVAIDAAQYAALVAERDALAQYHGGHLPTCGGMDTANRTCGCGYLDGEAYRSVIDENAALRTLLKDARSDLLIGTKASGWVLVQRIDTALGAERAG